MIKYHLFCIISSLLIFAGCFVGCVDIQQQAILENKVAALEATQSKILNVQKTDSYAMDQNIKKLAERLDSIASLEQYAEIKHDIRIIKERNQGLKGTIEEINHSLKTNALKTQISGNVIPLDKRIKDLENAVYQNSLKLAEIEKYLALTPSCPIDVPADFITKSGSDKAADKSKKDIQPDKSDKAKSLYDIAKKLFDKGDTLKARTQFENFLRKYPDSNLAGNARFWLAESFYDEKLYEKAILEYQKVLEDYPENNKVPGARLKQGYSFAALDEKENAGFILKELIKLYPDSDEAKLARKKLEILSGL